MSLEKARAHLARFGMDNRILEFDTSSATVELAAQAVGCEPARIAKTLSFLVEDHCVLIVAAGDARIDNGKFKAFFHTKARMPTADQVEALVGHAVGGVCPFGVEPSVTVYLDQSLRRYGVSRLRQRQQRHRADAGRAGALLRLPGLDRRLQGVGRLIAGLCPLANLLPPAR